MNACPNCLSPSLIVRESRQEAARRRRRYECRECGHRASSVEAWAVDEPLSAIASKALLAEIATRMGERL